METRLVQAGSIFISFSGIKMNLAYMVVLSRDVFFFVRYQTNFLYNAANTFHIGVNREAELNQLGIPKSALLCSTTHIK